MHSFIFNYPLAHAVSFLFSIHYLLYFCSFSARKVCRLTKNSNQPDRHKPFYVLLPGETFVTPYGIVEVVKDDRATPTGVFPPGVKDKTRAWHSNRAKWQLQHSKLFMAKAIQNRARRTKINHILQNGQVTMRTVFDAYYGGDPRMVSHTTWPRYRPPNPDPACPETSYPDRIVECLWIPDTRRTFHGLEDNEGTMYPETKEGMQSRTRMFLPRRLLTEPYETQTPTYTCLDCGQRFGSQPGQKYHIGNGVCKSRRLATTSTRKAIADGIQEQCRLFLTGGGILPYPLPNLPPGARTNQRDGRHLRKRIRPKKEYGMYPEVLISLGFKLLREDMTFEVKKQDAPVIGNGHLAVNPPDALLASLKEQLISQQRRSDDQKYGAMYIEVYKALGFRRPRKKRKRKEGEEHDEEKDTIGRVRRRRRAKKIKPLPPPKPLPPIIDTLALADEVDSGRYPSMNRYKDDDHHDLCFICKDGGELLCCDFCPKAVHLACVRKKFTIKDPEPEDDFMCHRCIQYILQRRARAEKRRLRKQVKAEQKRELLAFEESQKNPEIEEGMEYQHLAQKGQEVNELVEVLQDAQFRLRQSMETTKINNARRRMMGLSDRKI
jgi:hypothetical protein